MSLLTSSDAPVNPRNGYEVFGPLTDSVEFAAAHFDQLLPFLKSDKYRGRILSIANSLLDKKEAGYPKLVDDNYENLMAFAKNDLGKYLTMNDSLRGASDIPMYQYMQLMSKTKKHPLNDGLTKTYLDKDPSGVYASEALIARINNDLPINPVLVNKLLDSLNSRYDVMEAFSKQSQLNRVPLKYRQQTEFAKLCLYQSIIQDDYGAPEKITLLGSIIKNGSVYYAFKFSIPDYDEKNQLIGLTGPYKAGSTKLNFEHYFAYTGYDVLKTNWRAQATKMIKPLTDAYKQ
jgi:hypothetical protein